MLVRMGLTASVMWEKLDMQVVADVADGLKAYELFCEKKPDVLITDLVMPGMDGLSLIRKIRESGERCAVIVITCMDRFDMLHEAMELGVAAYLVKVTMSMNDIENALIKARDSLGPPRPKREEAPLERAQAAFEAYLFDSGETVERLMDRSRREHFDVLPEYYLYGAQLGGGQKISWQLQKALKGMILERLKSQHVLFVFQREGFFAALFTRTPKVHDMLSICEAFARYVKDSFGISLKMTASMESIAVEHLPERLEHIRAVSASIQPEDAPLMWFDAQGRLADTHIMAELEHLREALWQVSDYAFAYAAVERAYALEDAFHQDGELFHALAGELASVLWDKAGVAGQQRVMLEKGLEAEANPGMALQYICRYGVERLPSYRKEIRMVIAFAARHPEKDLALKKAAKLAALHPQYLSNLFKKEVGVNYSDFVCSLRLLAAQRILLQPGFSVRQAAEALGFSDQGYFCRKFKQMTGKSPVQWRRSRLCKS